MKKSSTNIGPDNRTLVQYESLRSQVLNRQTHFSQTGLALFIRKGMLVWMKTCQQSMPIDDTKRPQRPAFAYSETSQMVKVMANITLFNLEEALS